ncbi:MAG: peptide ABC transporter permease [Chloroflexi bacterium RBG_16_54_11]|nr:MAG: peptide ABC transporter permease [Chloroflexi bacterium RBG_16_54_11]
MRSLIWRRFRRHPGAILGCIVLGAIILAVIFAGVSPYDPGKSDLSVRYQAPTLSHPMGTDALGRDLMTRVLYGGRISLLVGLSVMAITLLIGVPVGALAGYFGGRVDNILMRITDAALSMPSLLVLILLSAILREVDAPFLKNNPVLTIASVIGLLAWMFTARLVRASYLAIREMDYVTATRALGATNMRIIAMHIFPNAIGPVIVEATLEVAYAILEESGLSYLGFGIQPPTPSWGNLLSNAQEHLVKYPWLAIFPGLLIFLSVISINYIGDGLRDAFDPYKVLKKMGEV